MQWRAREGKGGKERVLPLSVRLLAELETYWRAQRAAKPGHDSPWLFLGEQARQPINRSTGQNIYYRALKNGAARLTPVRSTDLFEIPRFITQNSAAKISGLAATAGDATAHPN